MSSGTPTTRPEPGDRPEDRDIAEGLPEPGTPGAAVVLAAYPSKAGGLGKRRGRSSRVHANATRLEARRLPTRAAALVLRKASYFTVNALLAFRGHGVARGALSDGQFTTVADGMLRAAAGADALGLRDLVCHVVPSFVGPGGRPPGLHCSYADGIVNAETSITHGLRAGVPWCSGFCGRPPGLHSSFAVDVVIAGANVVVAFCGLRGLARHDVPSAVRPCGRPAALHCSYADGIVNVEANITHGLCANVPCACGFCGCPPGFHSSSVVVVNAEANIPRHTCVSPAARMPADARMPPGVHFPP